MILQLIGLNLKCKIEFILIHILRKSFSFRARLASKLVKCTNMTSEFFSQQKVIMGIKTRKIWRWFWIFSIRNVGKSSKPITFCSTSNCFPNFFNGFEISVKFCNSWYRYPYWIIVIKCFWGNMSTFRKLWSQTRTKRFEKTKCKAGTNVPLSYNSANILVHLIDFLNKRREVNPPKIRKLDPPSLIKK